MKRFWFLLALFALGISLLVACHNNSGILTTAPVETLVMATAADFPPYEFIDDSGGRAEVQGFDIDVSKRITQTLGYELQINNLDFDDLIPALQSGRADFVMAGLVPTEARRQQVDFSQPYYQAENAILAQQSKGLLTPENLSGKTVGVQRGSIQAQRAREIQNIKIKSFEQIGELVQALKAGSITAALVEARLVTSHLAANPDLASHVILPIPGKTGCAIAFAKGSPLIAEFDRVIGEMQASGQMDKLVLQWFGQVEPSADS